MRRAVQYVVPSPGQPFQPTTAAVNSVNGAIGAAAADAAGYTNQEATAAGEMAAVTQVV